jgi:pilus assembly protein Flp/PilA
MSDLMLKLYVQLQTLRAREEGQGMVEYGLILVLVSVVALVALTAIGTNVNVGFEKIKNALA